MNYPNTIGWGICLVLLIMACERPESPDFSLEHKVQVPVTAERTYQFLGKSNALIDTTKSDYQHLFEVSQTGENAGLVSLSKQEDLEFGDLADALPEVTIAPTQVSSKVGEIVLGSFASGTSTIAEVGFEDVTDQSSTGVQNKDPVPDKTNHQIPNIEFKTDQFVSATIKSGSLEVSVENQLGFDIDDFSIEVFSQGMSLGTVDFQNGTQNPLLYNDGVKTGTLPVDGEQLENLKFTLTVSWTNKKMQTDTPGPFIVDDVTGNNLIASQVKAAVPSQDFSASGNTQVDNTNFSFETEDHYIELNSGELRVFDIINKIDLGIDQLSIVFPTIRRSPYTESDALEIPFENISKAGCGCVNGAEQSVSLKDFRIYTKYDAAATDYVVPYTITGYTEDTQQSKDIRTINENDSFSASSELSDLKTRAAHGVITSRRVLLNEDNDQDGNLDLSNKGEVTSVAIDGLKNLSTDAGELQFTNPVLNLLYNSNLDVETTIYAAIQGVNSEGNTVYLSGKSGDYKVNSSIDELQVSGQPLLADKLIRFKLKRPDGSNPTGTAVFNKDNSNADKFLNNLPSEIRFIGLAAINKPELEGTVTDPVRFEPSMGIDVPLYFASSQISFSDTTEADLSDLPDGKDQSLSEAKITMGYANRLPFGMELSLVMLDGQYQQLTEIPLSNEEPITLKGAEINQESRFAEQESEGKMELALSREQLDVLSQVRHMVIHLSFSTTGTEEVKVRAEDELKVSVKISVGINSNIN